MELTGPPSDSVPICDFPCAHPVKKALTQTTFIDFGPEMEIGLETATSGEWPFFAQSRVRKQNPRTVCYARQAF